MPDLKVRIIFSLEGLAGVKAASDNTAGIEQNLQRVEHETQKAGQQIYNFGQRSGVARMAVISFSQGLQDASMFQQSFRMGMMGIGNNVDMVVQSLTMLKEESKRTGVSMGASLLQVIKGPSGILVGISVLITLLQVLPGLFSNTSKTAKEASQEGLKDFAEWLKQFNDKQLQTIAAATEMQIQAEQKQIDALGKLTFDPVLGKTVLFMTTEEEAMKKDLEEQIVKIKERKTEIDKSVEASKAHAQVLQDEEEILKQHGTEYQKLVFKQNELLDAQKAGFATEQEARKNADDLAAVRKKIQAYTQTTEERNKLYLEQTQEKIEYEEALLADKKGSLETLLVLLEKEIQLTKNAKDRYEIEKKIAGLKKVQALGPVTPVTVVEGKTPIPKDHSLSQLPQSYLPDYGTIAEHERALSTLQEHLAHAMTETKREELRKQIKYHQDALARMEMRESDYSQDVINRWRQEGNAAGAAFDAMEAGLHEFENQFLLVHRNAKNGWDAIWISMENTAIASLANIVTKAIENLIVTQAIEATATAAEVAQMSAIAASAAPAALAVNIATMGAAGLAAAGTAAVAGASLAAAMKTVDAIAVLAEGTKISKPTLAMLGEAGDNEFIAPEKTFYQIAETEIVPRILAMAANESLAINHVISSRIKNLPQQNINVNVDVGGELKADGTMLKALIKKVTNLEKRVNYYG